MSSYWIFTNKNYWKYPQDALMKDLISGHYFGRKGQTGMSDLISKLAIL